MIVLGLDPGTAATGFGVVQAAGGRLRALAHGVVRTPAGEQPALRLAAIHERVRELAAAHGPDAAAVEDLFVRENPRTILSVGEARGAALAALGSLGVPVHTYTAPTIKSAVCGYGKAEKAQVQQMVRAILALDRAAAAQPRGRRPGRRHLPRADLAPAAGRPRRDREEPLVIASVSGARRGPGGRPGGDRGRRRRARGAAHAQRGDAGPARQHR